MTCKNLSLTIDSICLEFAIHKKNRGFFCVAWQGECDSSFSSLMQTQDKVFHVHHIKL